MSKTTTISIHVPLTEKVLEGLEDKKEYVFEKSNGNCVLRTRRWVQNDFSVNKNKTFINLLVRRSFTEEEIDKGIEQGLLVNKAIISDDFDYEKGFQDAINWALSPKENREGK